MIMAPLLAVSLVASVATGPLPGSGVTATRTGPGLQTVMREATDCIVKTIAADPRWQQASADTMLGELIVDSMPACANKMRAMIDAYDASFGDGTGEAFFMGPYLDVLPGAASRGLKASAPVPDAQ